MEPPGQLQKGRLLRGVTVEVAKAGRKRTKRRRTLEEGSRAPCLSETALLS